MSFQLNDSIVCKIPWLAKWRQSVKSCWIFHICGFVITKTPKPNIFSIYFFLNISFPVEKKIRPVFVLVIFIQSKSVHFSCQNDASLCVIMLIYSWARHEIMIWCCSKYSLGKYLMRSRPIRRPDYSPATKNLHKNVSVLDQHNNSKAMSLESSWPRNPEETRIQALGHEFWISKYSTLFATTENARWPIFLRSLAKIKKNPWLLRMLSNLADIPIHLVCLFWRQTSE